MADVGATVIRVQKNPILTISKGSSFPAENRQQSRYLLNEVVCSTQFARWFRTEYPSTARVPE
jgi:hypothetical protein